jgi:predicted Zn-dependent peptidase
MTDEIAIKRTAAGIPVVAERIADSRSAGYMVAVGTGSRDESEDVMGISHLLEHVVFRATKTRSSYQMAKEMEGAGGELNAFTSKECTAFYGVTMNETAAVARDMVSDIVANPLINEEDVQLEKKIVLQEISMVRNDPESYIHDLFSRTMWRGHKLAQDEAGEIDIVKGLGSKELRAYYEDRYKVQNMAVFAAGDVDIDETVEWAEEKFDPMTGGSGIVRTAPSIPGAKYDFIPRKEDHCYVAMGFPAYGADSKDRAAVLLLSALLGSGTSSRLFQGVREEKALVYSIFTSVEQSCDASSVGTYMSATEDNVIEAVETTARIFGDLRDDGPDAGELQRARNLVKGATIRSVESTENRLYRLTRNFMLLGKPESYTDRLAAMDKVTEEDIRRVAKDLIRADRLNMTVLAPQSRHLRKFDLSSLSL